MTTTPTPGRPPRSGPDEPASTLGAQLRAYRLHAGLSQAELASAASLSPDALGRYERDEQQPASDQLDLLLRVLNVPTKVSTQLRRRLTGGTTPTRAQATGGTERAGETAGQHAGTSPQIWSAPRRYAHFTGRSAELDRLRTLLRRPGGAAAVVPVALHGLGGVGKTQLAIEYAHRFKQHYDVVWWIRAEQLELIDAELAALGARLGSATSGSVPEDAQRTREALRRGVPHSRWLLIFDNAGDPAELTPYLPDPGAGGHLLLTSRDQSWSRAVETLTVDVFSRGESVAHLVAGVRGLTRADADAIAATVGDLPLAVESATAWLAAAASPPGAYLEELGGSTSAILSLVAQAGQSAPAANPWSLAIAQLRHRHPGGARLLELAAFMDPDGIDNALIYSAAMCESMQAVDASVTDRLAVGQLVREVTRLSLMQTDGAELRVHRLVQATVRDGLSPELQEETIHEVHRLLAAARPAVEDLDDPADWSEYARIWPHLAPSNAQFCDEEPVRELLIDRIRYLWRLGEYDRARTFAEPIAAAWAAVLTAPRGPQVLVPLRLQWLRLRGEIANTARSQGRFREALAADYDIMAQQLEILPQRHRHNLRAAGRLAASLRHCGQYRDALLLDEQTYADCLASLPADDPETLRAANNLAISYRLSGNTHRARELDESTLRHRRARYSPNHPWVLNSISALSRDLLAEDRCDEAVQLLESIGVDTEEIGGKATTVGETVSVLAMALAKAGRTEEALPLAVDAHAFLAARLGPASPRTAICAAALASVRAASGQAAAAASAAQGAYDACTQTYGEDHPLTLACLANLGVYLRQAGRGSRAMAVAAQAADGLRERLGPDHLYTCAASAGLANCLADRGEAEAAEVRDRFVVGRFAQDLGSAHSDTLAAMGNLAATLRALHRRAEARRTEREIESHDAARPSARRLLRGRADFEIHIMFL